MRNSWILTEHHIAFDFIIGMFNFIQGKPGPTPHLHSSSNIDYQILSFETFFNHDIWDDGVHLSVIQQVMRYILIYMYYIERTARVSVVCVDVYHLFVYLPVKVMSESDDWHVLVRRGPGWWWHPAGSNYQRPGQIESDISTRHQANTPDNRTRQESCQLYNCFV